MEVHGYVNVCIHLIGYLEQACARIRNLRGLIICIVLEPGHEFHGGAMGICSTMKSQASVVVREITGRKEDTMKGSKGTLPCNVSEGLIHA